MPFDIYIPNCYKFKQDLKVRFSCLWLLVRSQILSYVKALPYTWLPGGAPCSSEG